MSDHKRLDQILQSKGHVSERQIREALIKQSVLGGRLGEHLIRRGEVGEAELVEALSEQCGLPGICLAGRKVEPELFARVPFTVAEQHRCVPLSYSAGDDTLEVAFANPHDRAALHAVSGAAHPTKIKPYVAAAMHVRKVLAAHRRDGQPDTDVAESSDSLDSLLDLLELAVASGAEYAAQPGATSAWVSRLASDIAERMNVSSDQRRRLRLAALVSNVADWRRGSPDRSRPGIIGRSVAVLRDLSLPWDIVPLLQTFARKRNPKKTNDLSESVLRVAWALADSLPDGDDDATLEQWKEELRADWGDGLDPEVIKTAFTVLRVRSLRRRLNHHPPEIVVIGNGAMTDELLDALRETQYRVVNAQSWAEGTVLLDRRRPDLVCVVASILTTPPPLVLEGQIAEHGIDPASVLVVVPQRANEDSNNYMLGVGMAVTDDSNGVAGVMERIREMLPGNKGNTKHHGANGRAVQPGPSVTGQLADLGLPDLVQVLSSGQKTAHVELTRAHSKGSLWFEQGQIAAARTDRQTGDEAFFNLLTWTEGRFAVHTVDRIPDRNISTQTTALLLEGFRRMDESQRAVKSN